MRSAKAAKEQVSPLTQEVIKLIDFKMHSVTDGCKVLNLQWRKNNGIINLICFTFIEGELSEFIMQMSQEPGYFLSFFL